MPAQPMTLLRLEPNDVLVFGPASQGSTPSRQMKITNTSAQPVAFKVKTTAPKCYLVKPSSGTIAPGNMEEVTIMLQPAQLKNENQTESPAQHRFLVQAVELQTHRVLTREEWAEHTEVQEQRLKVQLGTNLEAKATEPEAEPSKTPGKQIPDNTNTSGDLNFGGNDLAARYDTLVKKTLKLETKKKILEVKLAAVHGNEKELQDKLGPVQNSGEFTPELQAEIKQLRSQARPSESGSCCGLFGGSYNTVHIIIVALVAFLASFFANELDVSQTGLGGLAQEFRRSTAIDSFWAGGDSQPTSTMKGTDDKRVPEVPATNVGENVGIQSAIPSAEGPDKVAHAKPDLPADEAAPDVETKTPVHETADKQSDSKQPEPEQSDLPHSDAEPALESADAESDTSQPTDADLVLESALKLAECKKNFESGSIDEEAYKACYADHEDVIMKKADGASQKSPSSQKTASKKAKKTGSTKSKTTGSKSSKKSK